jgi:hypothetical protein
MQTQQKPSFFQTVVPPFTGRMNLPLFCGTMNHFARRFPDKPIPTQKKATFSSPVSEDKKVAYLSFIIHQQAANFDAVSQPVY